VCVQGYVQLETGKIGLKMTSGKDASSKKGSGQVIGLDQRQLLIRHANGDASAFSELVSIFRGPVYTYLMRCGVDQAVRDDLFQEIFIKIHKASGAYQPQLPLTPWIYTIVANTVRSHYRKMRVQQIIHSGSQEAGAVTQSLSQDQTIARETAAWLEFEIKKLPFKQREVLLLCCTKGLERQEVAEILGVPVNTVKTQLRRARLALAKALARRNAKIKSEVSS
jgi:RNA polymerase sigma-70 factor, ECF subfamily